MLVNNSKLIGCPILSLHTASAIAHVSEIIIDPNDLKIIGFKLEGKQIDKNTGDILPINSVREYSRMGMIIDSVDEIAKASDVLHIQKILKLNFSLIGLKVVSSDKTKLGKLISYTVSIHDWSVKQIIVQRPLIKSFFDAELVIARSKIIEVDDYKVVIKSEKDQIEEKSEDEVPADFIPNFVNPFRDPDFVKQNQDQN